MMGRKRKKHAAKDECKKLDFPDFCARLSTPNEVCFPDTQGAPPFPRTRVMEHNEPQRQTIDYNSWSADSICKLRQVPEDEWFPSTREPHVHDLRFWTVEQEDLYRSLRSFVLHEHMVLHWGELKTASEGRDIKGNFSHIDGLDKLVSMSGMKQNDDIIYVFFASLWIAPNRSYIRFMYGDQPCHLTRQQLANALGIRILGPSIHSLAYPYAPAHSCHRQKLKAMKPADQKIRFLFENCIPDGLMRNPYGLTREAYVTLNATKFSVWPCFEYREGFTPVMQWVLYHLMSHQPFDFIDLMISEMEDAIYDITKRRLPYGPYILRALDKLGLMQPGSYIDLEDVASYSVRLRTRNSALPDHNDSPFPIPPPQPQPVHVSVHSSEVHPTQLHAQSCYSTLETILQQVQQQNVGLQRMVRLLESNSLRLDEHAPSISDQESRFSRFSSEVWSIHDLPAPAKATGGAHPVLAPRGLLPAPAASRPSREVPLTTTLESIEPMVETVSSLPSKGLPFESTEMEKMEGFSVKEARPRLNHEVIKADDRCGLETIDNQTIDNQALRETMSNGGGVNSMKVQTLKFYTRKGAKERRPNHDAKTPKTKVINGIGDGVKKNSTDLCQTKQNCHEDSINDPSNNLSSKIIPLAIEREALEVRRAKRRSTHAKFSTKEDANKSLKGMPQHKVLKDSAPWMVTPKQNERMKKACTKFRANRCVDKRPQVRRKLNLSNEPPHTSQGGTETYKLRPLGKKHYDESDHNGNRSKRMAAMERDSQEEDIHINKLMDDAREAFKSQADHFLENLGSIIAPRKLTWWGGTVVTSVIGTFLTQNVTDDVSSNAFMNIAAKFCSSRRDGSVVECSNVPLFTDDEEGSPHTKSVVSNGLAQNGRCLEDLIVAFRSGKLVNWEKHDIMKLLNKSFKRKTAKVISEDIDYVLKTNTSCWENLMEEAHEKGYKKENGIDAIDWEAVLQAPFADIEDCIKHRGQQFKMTLRILAFLIRIKRDHGHIDLQWLKYVSPQKAREYLLSIRGLGIKSVNCISLLVLRFGGFPVDTNVSRIATRLGWVPLIPLHSSLKFHEVTKCPPDQIHQYLWPLIDATDIRRQYELHTQLMTFGKTICTESKPNCGSCPFTAECKYYASMRRSDIDHQDSRKYRKQLVDKGQPEGRSSTPRPNEYLLQDIEDIEDRPRRKEQIPTGEYIGYIIPDQDIKKFGEFDERSIDDPNPYLFIVHSCDKENAKGTILIPCRTANKGIFPLNGTYFQENEVFADHSSSYNPIEIRTTLYANFDRVTIRMGPSITTVTNGKAQEKIRMIFKGYYCKRGFDLNTRSPRPLCTQLYASKKIGKKSRHELHLIMEE